MNRISKWFHNVSVIFNHQKKPLKNKVTQLLRRASTMSAVRGGKSASGYSPNETKVCHLKSLNGHDLYTVLYMWPLHLNNRSVTFPL